MELKEYIKEIKIGDITVKHNVFLAPMAGVTDLPFRYICNKYGGVVYTPTEMVSTRGLVYQDKKTHKIMDMHENESPKVIQIFGSEPDIIKQVVIKLNESPDVDIIHFYMGCPAPKVVKNGDGSELLKDLDKVEKFQETGGQVAMYGASAYAGRMEKAANSLGVHYMNTGKSHDDPEAVREYDPLWESPGCCFSFFQHPDRQPARSMRYTLQQHRRIDPSNWKCCLSDAGSRPEQYPPDPAAQPHIDSRYKTGSPCTLRKSFERRLCRRH